MLLLRWMRRLLTLLAALTALVLLAALAAVIVLLVHFSAYRGALETLGSQALGRPVTVAGEMTVHPALLPTIRVGEVRIANPPWASRPDLVRAGALAVQFELAALVQGRFDIREVTLVDADILLESRPDGRNNWAFGAGTPAGAAPAGTPSGGAGLERVRVRRSMVTYRSGTTGETTTVYVEKGQAVAVPGRPLAIELAGRYREQPFSIELAGGPADRLLVGTEPWPVEATGRVVDARFSVDGTLRWAAAGSRFDLDASLEGERLDALNPLLPVSLPAWGPYRAAAHLSQRPDGVHLDDLSVRVGGSDAAGDITVVLSGQRPRVQGRVTDGALRIADLVPADRVPPGDEAPGVVDYPLPTAPLRAVDVDLQVRLQRLALPTLSLHDLEGRLVLDGGRARAEPLALTLAGARISGRLAYDARGDVPAAALRAGARGFAHAPVLRAFGLETGVGGAVERLEADLTATGVTLRDWWHGLGGWAAADGVDVVRAPGPRNRGWRVRVAEARAQADGGTLTRFTADGRFRDTPLSVELSGGSLPALAAGRPAAVQARGRAADALFSFAGEVAWARADARFDLREASLSGKRLDGLDALLGVSLPAWGPYRIIGRVAQVSAGYALTGFEARVGESEAAGHLTVRLDGPRPRLEGALRGETLRLADFRPAAPPGAPEPADPLAVALPVAGLRALDLELRLSAGRVLAAGEVLREVTATVALDDGRLEVSPLALTLRGVRASGRLVYDVRGQVPAASLDASAETFPVGPLLAALGLEASVRGTAERLRISLEAEGRTLDELWRAFDGTAEARNVAIADADAPADPARRVQVRRAGATARQGGLQRLRAEGRYRDLPVSLEGSGGAFAVLVAGEQPWPLRVEATAPDVTLELQGTVSWRARGDRFDLATTLAGASPAALNPLLGIDLPRLGEFRLQGRLGETDDGYAVRGFVGRLGGTRASGSLRVDPHGERPRLEARLTAPVLDLDDFRRAEPAPAAAPPQPGPPETLPPGEAPAPDGRVIPRLAMPVETLRAADVELELVADRLRKGDTQIGDAALVVHVRDGRLELRPSRATLFGSTVFGRFEFDAGASPPPASVELWVERFDYGRLLRAYDLSDAFTGQAGLGIRLQGHGSDLRQFLAGADGRVEFIGGEGRIERQYLQYWGVDVLTWWKPLLTGQVTEMNCAVGVFDVAGGVAKTRVLLLDTTQVTVEGQGQLNLGTEEIDLKLRPIPKSPSLFRVATPVRVQGPLTRAEVGPAARDVFLDAAWLLFGYSNPLALLFRFGSLGQLGDNPCVDAITQAEGGRNGGDKPAGTEAGERPDIVERTESFLRQQFGRIPVPGGDDGESGQQSGQEPE